MTRLVCDHAGAAHSCAPARRVCSLRLRRQVTLVFRSYDDPCSTRLMQGGVGQAPPVFCEPQLWRNIVNLVRNPRADCGTDTCSVMFM